MDRIKGYWWLPDNENNKLNGVLYKSDEGKYLLELFGNFENSHLITENKTYEIINGFSSKGIKYTLVDSFLSNQSMSIPGFPESTLLVNIVYENLLASSKEDIKFNYMCASFLFLDDWILINGFKYNSDHTNFSTEIFYKLPEPIKYNINDEFTLIINFLSISSPININQKEVSIKQSIEIKIIGNENTIEWYLNIFQAFKYLLTLLINNNTKKTYLKGQLSSNTRDKLVNMYFNDNNEKINRDKMLFHEYIFSFPNIQDRFQNILNIWYKNYKTLSSSYALFFNTAYQSGLNLENKYLNIIHAVESYHRRNPAYPSEYIGKDEYEKTIYPKMIASIPNDLDEDIKTSLKSRIKFGYEYSLRKRIKELINSNKGFLNSFINESDNLQKQIVDTRNYYTHYDEKTKFVKEEAELYYLCEKLKVIMIVLFLFDIGFDKDEIRTAVEKQEAMNRLINISNANSSCLYD